MFCQFVVDVPQHILTQKLLDTKGVYILDCFGDVFIWLALVYKLCKNSVKGILDALLCLIAL